MLEQIYYKMTGEADILRLTTRRTTTRATTRATTPVTTRTTTRATTRQTNSTPRPIVPTSNSTQGTHPTIFPPGVSSTQLPPSWPMTTNSSSIKMIPIWLIFSLISILIFKCNKVVWKINFQVSVKIRLRSRLQLIRFLRISENFHRIFPSQKYSCVRDLAQAFETVFILFMIFFTLGNLIDFLDLLNCLKNHKSFPKKFNKSN